MLTNLSLFIILHKQHVLPKANYCYPVQAGKVNSNENLSSFSDAENDNIGHLNKYFAELTALYSIWKNKWYSESAYWGLAHYRRFFCLEMHWTKIKKKNFYYLPVNENSLNKIFSKQLERFYVKNLSPQTIILPKRQIVKDEKSNSILTAKQFYCNNHVAADWELAKKAIHTICPDYIKSFEDVEQQTQMLFFNMMIAHKDVWEHYCNWLFAILFEMMKHKTDYEEGYQQRVYGFLAERLLQVYLHHHTAQYKFVYMPVAILK